MNPLAQLVAMIALFAGTGVAWASSAMQSDWTERGAGSTAERTARRREQSRKRRKHHKLRQSGEREANAPTTRENDVPIEPRLADEGSQSVPSEEALEANADSVSDADTASNPPPPGRAAELHGFGRLRFLAAPNAATPILLPQSGSPTAEQRTFVEANLQPSLRGMGGEAGAAADFSLYAASAGSSTHLALINELYADLKQKGVYLLAGRRHIVWGSGLGFNPTDILNPAKNPLDIEEQRTGAFLLPMVEVQQDGATVTLLVSPALSTNTWALPTGLDFGRPIISGRVYTLAGGADVNLIMHEDVRNSRLVLGASVSRTLGDSFEVHAEGATWSAPPPSPVPGLETALGHCGLIAPGTERRTGSLVVGGRFDMAEQSWLALEYFYRGDGLLPNGIQALTLAAPCIRDALMQAPPSLPNPVGHPADPALVMLEPHYVSAAFVRPHLTANRFEDVSIGATAIWGIEEGSLTLQAHAAYHFFNSAQLGVRTTWLARHDEALIVPAAELAIATTLTVTY